MTRSELIASLAGRFPSLTAADVNIAVKEVLGALADTLSNGNRIEIRGFGTFSLNHRAPRTGRNPKSGAPVAVPAKLSPHFRPGKELAERVDSQQ